MVHLAGVAGFDDQTDVGAGALPHQVVVHGADGEQRRDRGHLLVGFAVGQHDDPRAVGDRRRHLRAHVVQAGGQPGAALGDRVQAADSPWSACRAGVRSTSSLGVEVDQLGQLVVAQNRLWQHDLVQESRSG